MAENKPAFRWRDLVGDLVEPSRLRWPEALLALSLTAAYISLSFLADGRHLYIIIVLAALTCLSLFWRVEPCLHLGLLLTLGAICLELPPLRDAWPLPPLMAIAGYLVLVGAWPRLRRTLEWPRLGRLGRREWRWIALTVLVSSSALVIWFVAARPDLAAMKAKVPAWSPPWLVFAGICFACGNAFAEEVIFRGLIQQALTAAFGRIGGLGLQAAAFGLLHIHGFPSGWSGVGLAAIYGLMLGAIRLVSRGLLAPWVAHIFADLTIFGILVLLAG